MEFAMPKLPSAEDAIYIIATEGYYPGHPMD